nr:reverse transcriptase domain-containing protein [Tanacetum cinerariifolium]
MKKHTASSLDIMSRKSFGRLDTLIYTSANILNPYYLYNNLEVQKDDDANDAVVYIVGTLSGKISDDGVTRKATGEDLRKAFRSRLTPDKNARYSSELHASCRSLVLGQPQDEANAYVLYISGIKRALALSEQEYSPREQIEGYLLALRSLLKEHNWRRNVSPIRLSFDNMEDQTRARTVVTGKEVGDADLKRPFKEAVKTPLTRRIIEFAGLEFKMPENIKLYDGTTDPEDHLSRFSSAANSGEWPLPVWCHPTKITKIVRKANETLVAFKERWIVETGFITGVPEVMKISSFMDSHKCPELAKRYSDKAPKTMDEMTTRLDDFLRSEEAFASMEPPKGEASRKSVGPINRREDRFHMGGYGADRRKNEGRSTFNNKDGLVPYRTQTPYQAPRDQGFHHPRFNLGSLTKLPMKILASEPQLNLQPPRPMQLPPKKKNQNKYYASDEPLIIEAVMEGYLVRRVYVDQGASVEVMFEHCFENLSPVIRSRLRGTQMDLVGFARGVDGLKIPPSGFLDNTLHGKFPTPRGVTTLVTRSAIIYECRRLERKQMVEQEVNQNINQDKEVPERVDLTEHTLVNPAYPDQLMAQDEDTDQGTYYYTKMPFGLKNAGATYQRLVDTAFQSQIGGNLKAYVDDMAITLLRNSKGHDKGKQGRIPLDRKHGKGILRDENGHSRAVTANHPSKGGNTIRICGSDNRG